MSFKNVCFVFFIVSLLFSGCSMHPGYYGSESFVEDSNETAIELSEKVMEIPAVDSISESPAPIFFRRLPVGEKLTFSIRWLGLEAGRTTATIKEMVKINGRDAYHIETYSKTSPIIDLLFPIRDFYDSYIDARDFFTYRLTKKALEGKHHFDEINEFDYLKNKAYYINHKSGEKKVTEIPGKVQDIVSVSYWFRAQDAKVGDQVKTVLHVDEKNYDVTIHVLKKDAFQVKDKAKVPMIIIEPKAKRGGKPFTKGRAKIWVTEDEERLPLFAELKVIIAGTLNVVLLSKENINPSS